MEIEEIIDKINKSIYKDANKNMVVYGKTVRDLFLEKNNTIEHLERRLEASNEVSTIYERMMSKKVESQQEENQKLKREVEELKQYHLNYINTEFKGCNKNFMSIYSLMEENQKLKERVKELENYIISGKTKTTLRLSDGTVRLPDNYEGIEG